MREFREAHDSEEKLRVSERKRMTFEEAREYVKKFDKSLAESKVENEEISNGTKFEEVMDDIAREVSSDTEPKKEVENDRKELDIAEVNRLYFDEGLSLKDTGKHFGYKSPYVIRKIFEEQGWKLRPQRFSLSEMELEVAHRLYREEKPLLEIAKHFGLKTSNPISRIINELGWEERIGSHIRTELDPEMIHRLYFEKYMSFRKIANHLGLRTPTPVSHFFKKQGWEPRAAKMDIDPKEIYSLYFERKLGMRSIGKQLGCHENVIRRIFKEEGWEARPTRIPTQEVDPLEVHRLYYEVFQTQKEIAEQFGFKSPGPIRRIFNEMGWTPRRVYESKEDQRVAEIEKRREKYQRVIELREQLFGLECQICGHEKKEIHKKDGEEHPHQLLWSINGLESLEVNDWVALCWHCHRAVHALMERTDLQYDEIESSLKKIVTKK